MQAQNVPAKKSFRVDELAKELGVKKFIIKNWEKQFDLKKCGIDNKYSQEDFKIFATIKNLVFIKKMPQALAKKHLQEILSGKDVIGKEVSSFKQELSEQMEQEFEGNVQANSEELAMQDIASQEVALQEVALQEIVDQDAAEMICKHEQEIAEIAMIEKAIQELAGQATETQQIPVQELTDQELAAEALAQAFIAKGLDAVEAEATFQGAHEDLESENITEPNLVSDFLQVDFAQNSEIGLPEETVNLAEKEEVLASQQVDNIGDIKPALQEKDLFIKNIQSFKEQLLKIHEQLK